MADYAATRRPDGAHRDCPLQEILIFTRSVIPLASPLTGDAELDEVRAVLESGYLSQGPKVAEFEEVVRLHTGSEYAFATSSCTTALHLCLAVLGIGPGDEVIVPDFTFPATANVVVQQGAVPVLVDIDLNTYNVDPGQLARHLTARTRAVIAVDLFGLAADMDPVVAFAAEHGLAVIEDAACAVGSTYHGRPCGSLADLGCFSFHARKVVTTGEGGMVVTNRDDLADRLRLLRSHGGLRRGNRFTFEDAGFNYRLSDIQAAVGTAQMRRLPDLVSRRRALAAHLCDELGSVPGITVPSEPSWGGHVYQSFVVLVDRGISRNDVIAGLNARGIESTLVTYALHAQPFFARTFSCVPGQLPESYDAFQRSLALPFYPQMEDADQAALVDGLRAVLRSLTT